MAVLQMADADLWHEGRWYVVQFKWLLKGKEEIFIFFFEHGKMMYHQRWSHNLFQKGDLGPQNAPTEMTSTFPVIICSVAPLRLAGRVHKNTFILLTSKWFHREGPGKGILPLQHAKPHQTP